MAESNNPLDVVAKLESAAKGDGASDFTPKVDFKLLYEARDEIERLRNDRADLQALLREARWYVYHADVPHAAAYEDQQATLQRIDELAPEPPPPPPRELCGKDGPHGAPCLSDKNHEGDCDDLPF